MSSGPISEIIPTSTSLLLMKFHQLLQILFKLGSVVSLAEFVHKRSVSNYSLLSQSEKKKVACRMAVGNRELMHE